MLERHKLLMGRTQDRAGQNNGSIGVFWRSFNGIIGHIRYMFRGLKITHNHEHSSLYMYRYHKPVKLKVFTRVEQFISNEIGYLTPNLECI